MVLSTWGWTHMAFCQVTGKDTGLILSSQGAYSAAQEQGSWRGGGGFAQEGRSQPGFLLQPQPPRVWVAQGRGE